MGRNCLLGHETDESICTRHPAIHKIGYEFTSACKRHISLTSRLSVQAATSSSSAILPLLHEFAHSGDAIRDIQANPHDRPEIVAVLRGPSGGSSFVELLDTTSHSVQKTIGGGSGEQFQTAGIVPHFVRMSL